MDIQQAFHKTLPFFDLPEYFNDFYFFIFQLLKHLGRRRAFAAIKQV
jgi:hypothetical protein